MVEKGAIARAKENLAKMQTLCRASCGEVAQLSASIEKGHEKTKLTAKDVQNPGSSVVKATVAEPPLGGAALNFLCLSANAIGRASCRERVCQDVSISVVGVLLK